MRQSLQSGTKPYRGCHIILIVIFFVIMGNDSNRCLTYAQALSKTKELSHNQIFTKTFDALSPEITIHHDLKSKLKYAYYHYQNIRRYNGILVKTLRNLEKTYESGPPAFVNGIIGNLISDINRLNRDNLEAWRNNLLHYVVPFQWEYQKTGRTIKTDKMLHEIHERTETLLGEKITKLYAERYEEDLILESILILSAQKSISTESAAFKFQSIMVPLAYIINGNNNNALISIEQAI